MQAGGQAVPSREQVQRGPQALCRRGRALRLLMPSCRLGPLPPVQTKPVVASMADVAASGGYYMAMACSKIVAEPLTITGSIGVVTGRRPCTPPPAACPGWREVALDGGRACACIAPHPASIAARCAQASSTSSRSTRSWAMPRRTSASECAADACLPSGAAAGPSPSAVRRVPHSCGPHPPPTPPTPRLLRRGKYAQLLAENKKFTPEEEALFDASATHAYESFRDKAALSRGMSVEAMQVRPGREVHLQHVGGGRSRLLLPSPGAHALLCGHCCRCLWLCVCECRRWRRAACGAGSGRRR